MSLLVPPRHFPLIPKSSLIFSKGYTPILAETLSPFPTSPTHLGFPVFQPLMFNAGTSKKRRYFWAELKLMQIAMVRTYIFMFAEDLHSLQDEDGWTWLIWKTTVTKLVQMASDKHQQSNSFLLVAWHKLEQHGIGQNQCPSAGKPRMG